MPSRPVWRPDTLLRAMDARGVGGNALARYCGVEVATVRNWVAGVEPDLVNLVLASRGLGLTSEALFLGWDEASRLCRSSRVPAAVAGASASGEFSTDVVRCVMSLRGMRQCDLAAAIGSRAPVVSSWVTGRHRPRASSGLALAHELGIDPRDLVVVDDHGGLGVDPLDDRALRREALATRRQGLARAWAERDHEGRDQRRADRRAWVERPRVDGRGIATRIVDHEGGGYEYPQVASYGEVMAAAHDPSLRSAEFALGF